MKTSRDVGTMKKNKRLVVRGDKPVQGVHNQLKGDEEMKGDEHG